LVQAHIVLDVVGDELAVFLRDGLEVLGGEDRIGGKVSEMAGFDDVPQVVAGGVGFEIRFQRRDSVDLFGFVVSDEFGEFLFKKIIAALEAGDKAENLLELVKYSLFT